MVGWRAAGRNLMMRKKDAKKFFTQQAPRDYRGELRIASVGLMCPSLLARLICAFRERFPKVEVSILQQNNFNWIEAAQKRADLGIGYVATESRVRPIGTLKNWIIA